MNPTPRATRLTTMCRGDAGTAIGTRRASGESGYVFAMMGLLMVPLVIMTAFAVDLGAWYAQGQRMQRASDAASLAGVVWTSHPTMWDTVARQTATKNGYTNGVNGVTVDVVKLGSNRIKVTIDADGDQWFSKIVLDNQRLTRPSTAEYVLPVPMGSPRNYLGTGGLGTGTGVYGPENLWAAVSGYCTDKVQGDRKAARYYGGTSGSTGGSANDCVETQNLEYDDQNYVYYIELPTTRSYNTDVVIYNGNFNVSGTCGAPGAPQPNEFCPGGMAGLPLMPTTMTLYRADATPLDDGDNPTMASVNGCATGGGAGTNGTKTFNPSILEDNYSFTPPGSFNNANGMWRLCRIPSGAPGGKYILRVRNQATTSGAPTQTNGSNAFSIIATPQSPQLLCDARTDTTCPKVYAKDYLSIYALAGANAEFFLAEIGPEHAGKRVRIQLWDSAEGADEIRIRRPTGANSWTDQTFDWSTSPACGGCAGTAVNNIDVTGSTFNGRLITIEFTLPANYNPPATNKWWRIRYDYDSSATDRTTWAVTVLGDPVHLVD